jgi:RNA polymerase sigma factor (sigma-70 family)
VAERQRAGDASQRGPTAGVRAGSVRTDAELLDEFVVRREEGAFAALVGRHGPMVLRLCRRLLADAHDAEDAFQATFLVLVRKAASIRKPELLGNWLYGVAHRVACRVRTLAARLRTREGQGAEMLDVQASDETEPSDVQPALHEEVNRLPDKYRVPVVLCYLEGKSNEEVARTLGRPVGTIKGWLARARKLLRQRLTRRGLALSTGMLAAALSENAATAALPHALQRVTLKAAMHLAGGGATPGGSVSPRVAALTAGVLRSLRLGQLRLVAVAVLAVGLVVVVIWVLLARGGRPSANGTTDEGARTPAQAARDVGDDKKLQGDWKVAAFVHNGVPMAVEDGPNVLWRFQGDRIVLESEGQVVMRSVFKLAPGEKPKAMDVTITDEGGKPLGEPEPWAYELDGDTLRLCKPIDGNTARPRELASKAGSRTSLMEFKRQPAGANRDGSRQ